MRRLVIFAVTDSTSEILLASMVKHVHLQVRFIDEGFVTLLTFDFSFRLMITNRVELQRPLGLKELITIVTWIWFFG